MKRFFIMFDECRFSVKCKEAFIAIVNRNLANIGNKIPWHTKIYFTFSFVEFRTLNQVHKNVVLLIFDTYKPLNYAHIVNRCQLVNFFGLVFKFFKPIKLPICFLYLSGIGTCQPNYFCIKTSPVRVFSIEFVSLSMMKSSPIFCFFFT